jgi:general secretion pathway protein I
MTLVEVLVALVIFSTALFAIVRCLGRVVRASRVNHEYELAALLAQRKLAEIELEGPSLYADDSGDFGDDYTDYQWTSETRQMGVPDLYEVKVAVRWQSVDRSRSWEVETYLYDSFGTLELE